MPRFCVLQVEMDEAGDKQSDAERFMNELKAKEERLGKYCMVLGTLENDSEEEEDEDEDEEDRPSMEKLQGLARVYIPKQAEIYYTTVSGIGAQGSRHLCCTVFVLLIHESLALH